MELEEIKSGYTPFFVKSFVMDFNLIECAFPAFFHSIPAHLRKPSICFFTSNIKG